MTARQRAAGPTGTSCGDCASAGASGVEALLRGLREDVSIALAQLGCASWRAVGPLALAESHLPMP